ncbi:MAG: Bax inhibitor-1/YccA family protein [Actinobacteria bacterium]|nr:Bax inhibitor-1/YccA family protein [Actinomycetota bacterium]MBI3686757.1 Bax inhibitor-1/YccA family protein [Actinomycetota bacterium]
MNSSNPVFRRGFPTGQRYATFNPPTPDATELSQMYTAPSYAPPRYMTLDDVVVRTAATLGTLMLTGAFSWMVLTDRTALGLIMPALLVGFVLGLVISFRGSTNPALILSYAAAQGLVLGGISRFMEALYNGIVIQAVVGTMGVFAGMLVVYRTGAIRVTPKFQRWLLASLIGVVVLMVVNMIASIFTPGGLGLRSGGGLAIVFSLICIGVAALSFLLDFEMVNQAVQRGAPEKFAWYAAFGLTVTLVWLYIEILRLLSYFRD